MSLKGLGQLQLKARRGFHLIYTSFSFNLQASKHSFVCGDRFLDNSDGTVTDCQTGLIWLKNAGCFVGRLSNVNAYVAGLSDGSVEGHWRLSTKEELQGIGTDPPITWEEKLPPQNWTKLVGYYL